MAEKGFICDTAHTGIEKPRENLAPFLRAVFDQLYGGKPAPKGQQMDSKYDPTGERCTTPQYTD